MAADTYGLGAVLENGKLTRKIIFHGPFVLEILMSN